MALYHCGVLASCPLHCVHIGGLEFPRTTLKITGYDDEQVNSELQGVVHEISDERMQLVAERVKKKVVRSTSGKNAKSFLLHKDNKSYQRMEGDVELETLIYIKPVDHDPQKETKHKSLAESRTELEASLAQGRVDVEKALGEGRAQLTDVAKELELDRNDLLEDQAELLKERLELQRERAEFLKEKEALAAEFKAAAVPAKPESKKGKKGSSK